MYKIALVSAFAALVCLAGCASVSSSSAPAVSQENWTTDPVYVTTSTVPADMGYEVIGHVKANARTGYDSVETLYPLLVQEARKVGANAVVGVTGGRSPSAFSWAAPFASGTAIRIDDVEKLEKYDGKYY